jgi:hypothetical protein
LLPIDGDVTFSVAGEESFQQFSVCDVVFGDEAFHRVLPCLANNRGSRRTYEIVSFRDWSGSFEFAKEAASLGARVF